jgi:1-acyl-sn-glycerol-3-phosphate acyltransferase
MLFLVFTWMIRPFDRHGTLLDRSMVTWARTMLWICRIQAWTAGLDRLDPSQQYVFVSNHASWIDIPVLIASLPHHLIFVAKWELFEMPLVGACLRRTGQIPVDRANARALVYRLRKGAWALHQNRRSLLLFAAGTRASSGAGEFKEGAAYLAIRAQLPVVPVGLSGTAAAMPRGAMRIRGAAVKVAVGEPIPTAGLNIAQRADLTRRLQDHVGLLLAEPPPKRHRAAAAGVSRSAC